jgi:hypothetical protein
VPDIVHEAAKGGLVLRTLALLTAVVVASGGCRVLTVRPACEGWDEDGSGVFRRTAAGIDVRTGLDRQVLTMHLFPVRAIASMTVRSGACEPGDEIGTVRCHGATAPLFSDRPAEIPGPGATPDGMTDLPETVVVRLPGPPGAPPPAQGATLDYEMSLATAEGSETVPLRFEVTDRVAAREGAGAALGAAHVTLGIIDLVRFVR